MRSLEFRVVLPGGEVRWYSSHGRRVVGEDDGRTALWGVTIDITERKRGDEGALTPCAANGTTQSTRDHG
jgi:PAS domain-containing protein